MIETRESVAIVALLAGVVLLSGAFAGTARSGQLAVQVAQASGSAQAELALGLGREDRQIIQSGLKLLGFDPGPADGAFGPRTRAAIVRWQASAGKPATGHLDLESARTLARKGIEAPPPAKRSEPRTKVAMATIAMALRAAGKIEEPGARAQALSEIAALLGKAGDMRRAKRVFTVAVTAAEKADNSNRNSALWYIAGSQARAGDIGGGLSTAKRIRDEQYLAAALGDIAKAQVAAGNTRQALVLAERPKKLKDRVSVLVSIAHAQVEVGDERGAAQSIKRALEVAERIADEDDRSWPFLLIARRQIEIGDIPQAEVTARRIPSENVRVKAFLHIFEMQAEAGDVEGSRRTLKTALATAGQVRDSLRQDVYFDIARTQAKFGDASGARPTLDLLLAEVEREPDKYSRALYLRYVASTRVRDLGALTSGGGEVRPRRRGRRRRAADRPGRPSGGQVPAADRHRPLRRGRGRRPVARRRRSALPGAAADPKIPRSHKRWLPRSRDPRIGPRNFRLAPWRYGRRGVVLAMGGIDPAADGPGLLHWPPAHLREPAMSKTEPRYLDTRQAAAYLGISPEAASTRRASTAGSAIPASGSVTAPASRKRAGRAARGSAARRFKPT